MDKKKLDIFLYNDPALFLRDHWLMKKKKNSSFSIRAWAKLLGISSHSQLHQMIYGKRAIPKKYLQPLATHLGLNQTEAEYLENLINIHRSKDESEKSFYHKKIITKRKKMKVAFHEIENFDLVKNPLHFFILEMFLLKGRKFSPEKIRDMLMFDYSLQEIKRAIDTLINLKLAVRISENEYAKLPDTIFTKSDVPSAALREYHKNLAEHAKQAVEVQPPLEREYNAVTFNIKKEDMPEAKEMIRQFRQEFVDRFIAMDTTGDRTYHLNINFFAVTKDI